MKPALGYNWNDSIHFWQDLPNGQNLFGAESDMVVDALSLCFGHHLLKVGSLSSQVNTEGCLIDHQISLTKSLSSEFATGVMSELDELPFHSNTIDAVLMNHVLEYCPDPHQVLREIHRVLMPNGNLVLTIFNPVSLLFLARCLPFSAKQGFWKGRFFSVARIKDWLNLLGFELIEEKYCAYSSLLTNKTLKNTGSFSKWTPKLGSVCMIKARKREWPLTPIRPRFRYKTPFRPVVTAPQTTKVIN